MSLQIRPSRNSAGRKHAKKRLELRDQLWPDAAEVTWSRSQNKGFTTVPRILPLVMCLINCMSNKGDPSRVYLDLWCRVFDEGFITIRDETEMAFSAGYSGTRAVRTWREHLQSLSDLGFLRTAQNGNRDIGHVLILNPYTVCAVLRKKSSKRIPDEWWSAFLTRANETGATIPTFEEILND